MHWSHRHSNFLLVCWHVLCLHVPLPLLPCRSPPPPPLRCTTPTLTPGSQQHHPSVALSACQTTHWWPTSRRGCSLHWGAASQGAWTWQAAAGCFRGPARLLLAGHCWLLQNLPTAGCSTQSVCELSSLWGQTCTPALSTVPWLNCVCMCMPLQVDPSLLLPLMLRRFCCSSGDKRHRQQRVHDSISVCDLKRGAWCVNPSGCSWPGAATSYSASAVAADPYTILLLTAQHR
jgi:hypothetical protein